MNYFMFMDFGLGLLREEIVKSLLKVCLAIDAIIYNLLTWLYGVFVTIAEARIFTSETVKPFLERIYLIIGIVALFFAAYTLVTLLINPDNLSNKSYSPTTVIRNVILSILAIVFVPTVFNFAYSVQGSIFKQNVIGKIFIGSDGKLADNKGNSFNEFSVMIFETSYYLVEENLDTTSDKIDPAEDCYNSAHQAAVDYNDITYYGECIDNVYSEPQKIHYSYFVSGIIGIVLVYVFLSYCIDVAIRCIKLALLQIIAPLPSLLLMVPGQDKAFKSWIKETLKTFFDVFVKMFILTFGVAMIRLVMDWFDSDPSILGNASKEIINFSKIFIFIGVCMFIKRAPKLLKDLFGFDFGENGISLRKRIDEFKDSIAPVTNVANRTAGMIGGAIAAGHAYKQGIQAGNKGNAFKKGLATFNGLRNGWNGGIRNIGAAYNYEMESQRSYALDKNKPMSEQIGNAIFDQFRDNLGFQTRYADEVRRREIRRDALLADAYQDSRAIETITSDKTREIENRHKLTQTANKDVKDKSGALHDAVNNETSKENSQITSTNMEMYQSKWKELSAEGFDLDTKHNNGEISDEVYSKKQELLQKQWDMLETFRNYVQASHKENDSFNNYRLGQEMEAISKNEALTNDIKSALNFVYDDGKGQNNIKYLEQDKSDWASPVQLAMQQLETATKNANAGQVQVFNTSTKQYENAKQLYDFKKLFEEAMAKGDFKSILKLKKSSGIAVDTDQMAKNDALNNIEFDLNLTSGSGKYTLYQLQQMQSQLTEYIDTLNKEVERFIEARKSEQQAADIRQKRNSNRPVFKSKHNGDKH